jgi:hypothetical protein
VGDRVKNIGHAYGQRNCAAGSALYLFLNLSGQSVEFDRRHAEIGKGGRRGINSEIVGRNQNAGGNQGHNGNKALRQHGTVTHECNVLFVAEHFRRGPRGNNGVETGDGAAGNGDEDVWEDMAGDDRSAATDKLRHSRHFKLGTNKYNADGQRDDGRNLQVRRKIVPRCEEEPDRQDRSDKCIQGERHRKLLLAEFQSVGKR